MTGLNLFGNTIVLFLVLTFPVPEAKMAKKVRANDVFGQVY